MTASELKAKHESHNPESKYFHRDSMRFFGDSMSNYGVRRATCRRSRQNATPIPGFELYRKRPVKHGLTSSAYFDAETFGRVYAVEDFT